MRHCFWMQRVQKKWAQSAPTGDDRLAKLVTILRGTVTGLNKNKTTARQYSSSKR